MHKSADPPCCTERAPEPGRAGRCAYLAGRGRCGASTQKGCPVACRLCVICRGHPLEALYAKLQPQARCTRTVAEADLSDDSERHLPMICLNEQRANASSTINERHAAQKRTAADRHAARFLQLVEPVARRVLRRRDAVVIVPQPSDIRIGQPIRIPQVELLGSPRASRINLHLRYFSLVLARPPTAGGAGGKRAAATSTSASPWLDGARWRPSARLVLLARAAPSIGSAHVFATRVLALPFDRHGAADPTVDPSDSVVELGSSGPAYEEAHGRAASAPGAAPALRLFSSPVLVADDVAHSLGAILAPSGRLEAFGGQFADGVAMLPFHLRRKWTRLNGLYHVRADRLDDLLSRRWFPFANDSSCWGLPRAGLPGSDQRGGGCMVSSPCPGNSKEQLRRAHLVLDGRHAGCVECRKGRRGACEFDGKVSVAYFRRRWLLFVRSNLARSKGGRHVQVAQSVSEDPRGRYAPFQTLEIAGMPRPAAHNTYFAAVKQNPTDARGRTLLGLFPTVLSGGGGSGGGGGDAAWDAGWASGMIGLSISCDGVHWAPLVRLRPTQYTDNRTWDQPVDGFELIGGSAVTVYVHVNVPLISSAEPSHLLPYTVGEPLLRRMTVAAHRSLPGCVGE